MPETFVPLVAHAVVSSRPAALFTSLTPKNSPASAPEETTVSTEADKCGKPTITLQKTGDVVSSIRVQCGCGQVTELNCVY